MKELVGRHGEGSLWAQKKNDTVIWVDNLFLATKFEHNNAVGLVEQLKLVDIKAYTEPLFSAANRLGSDYIA